MAHLFGIHRHPIKSQKRAARSSGQWGTRGNESRLKRHRHAPSGERLCRFRTAVQGNAGKSFKGRSRAHQTLEMDRELTSALAQQTARVMLNIMSVTLINPFELPPGREEDAVAYWDRCADVLRRQPGFISARLHHAIMPGARFALVNVAEWESAEHFQTAVSTSDFQAVAAPEASDFPHSPAMYDIVRTVH